jgi:hypothetical protein
VLERLRTKFDAAAAADSTNVARYFRRSEVSNVRRKESRSPAVLRRMPSASAVVKPALAKAARASSGE